MIGSFSNVSPRLFDVAGCQVQLNKIDEASGCAVDLFAGYPLQLPERNSKMAGKLLGVDHFMAVCLNVIGGFLQQYLVLAQSGILHC